MVKAAVTVLVTGVVGAYGVSEVQGLLRQRALEDTVSLSAAMNVTASSTTPTGGRVDFYLTLQNTGGLPISITAVSAVAPRLVITGQLTERGFPMQPIPPSQIARVSLSVVLDCTGADPQTDPVTALVAAVQAAPRNGRDRSVNVAVAQSALVTDIADTLCTIDPGISGDELDGPVAVP